MLFVRGIPRIPRARLRRRRISSAATACRPCAAIVTAPNGAAKRSESAASPTRGPSWTSRRSSWSCSRSSTRERSSCSMTITCSASYAASNAAVDRRAVIAWTIALESTTIGRTSWRVSHTRSACKGDPGLGSAGCRANNARTTRIELCGRGVGDVSLEWLRRAPSQAQPLRLTSSGLHPGLTLQKPLADRASRTPRS